MRFTAPATLAEDTRHLEKLYFITQLNYLKV